MKKKKSCLVVGDDCCCLKNLTIKFVNWKLMMMSGEKKMNFFDENDSIAKNWRFFFRWQGM